MALSVLLKRTGLMKSMVNNFGASRAYASVAVGTDLISAAPDVSLQKARSWDEGVSSKFATTPLKIIFKVPNQNYCLHFEVLKIIFNFSYNRLKYCISLSFWFLLYCDFQDKKVVIFGLPVSYLFSSPFFNLSTRKKKENS